MSKRRETYLCIDLPLNSSTNTISKQSPFLERATYHRARKYRLKIFSGGENILAPFFFFFFLHRWLAIIDDHRRYALDKARKSSRKHMLARGFAGVFTRRRFEWATKLAPRLLGLSRAMGRKGRQREREEGTRG